ncbi:flagellar motor protein MotB [Eoetvoesiella caeni]|uniref:Chemotaxis protein MotB n=1 Tax=Eoetvoesiella caeni TaxID=645616 RepID=A0A366HK50_9BURK|nr:flagellar motor protein MotB [Eoetvoesiella caeni]MCI2807268.1 flagellar motor protein MotB [Eoetvoesiella caeni]NYT53337.1 flagellar motor protein MotB [Eoetvoesiella caeni]RBP43319.1 chemotaxis protein MotB [Eoetvoesiella caeni]
MSQAAPDRIVIRRKKVQAHGHHGGAWKIAYADYMTAMMAFFLVMWLLSLIPRENLPGIAEYFRMPLMTAITGGPQMDNSRTVIPGGSPSVIPNKSPVPQRKSMSSEDAEDDRRDVQRLEDLKTDLEALIESNPVLRQFRPQLLLDMTPDGLRIQIVDEQNRPMFATGRAQVQPYMRDILRELGPMLNKLPNAITISGHTDALQYASGEREYSNWELSADRSNAARKELVAGGMNEQKVKRVLGLSSSVSLIKDNPNAAVNRRISLLVLNRRAERRIDAQDAVGESLANLKSVMEDSATPTPAHVDGNNAGVAPAEVPPAVVKP